MTLQTLQLAFLAVLPMMVCVGADSDRLASQADSQSHRVTEFGQSWSWSLDGETWGEGPAPLGYGDSHVRTSIVTANEKPRCAFFKKTFSIDNPTAVLRLFFDLLVDDGCIITLNGHEVIRYNMSDGDIANESLATKGVFGDDEQRVVPRPVDLKWLKSGVNTIEARVHQCVPNSTDLVFDLSVRVQPNSVEHRDAASADLAKLGLKARIYAPNADPAQFKWPTHIAFGPGEQEIVTDLKNSRFLYREGPAERLQVSPVAVRGPHSLVYNPADQLYYANDTENHRIIAFADLSSETITAETHQIAGVPLQRPHDIVLDPTTGWMYVINPNSGQVFRFTAIGENESVLNVPVQGYARALTFANGTVYAIGSSKGRIVEIVDWGTETFKVYDSFNPTGKGGAAGAWAKTGLVLNDAEFFNGFWYATSYFTKSYARGFDFDVNKFIRFKTLDDLVTGKWTDLSRLVPHGMTPYYLSVQGDRLYLAIFNHESPGQGDAILELSPTQMLRE